MRKKIDPARKVTADFFKYNSDENISLKGGEMSDEDDEDEERNSNVKNIVGIK